MQFPKLVGPRWKAKVVEPGISGPDRFHNPPPAAPSQGTLRVTLLAMVALGFVVSEARSSVVTRWSFEGNLQDSAEGGVSADHLAAAAYQGPLDTTYVPGVVGLAVQVGETYGDATVLSAADSDDLDLQAEFTVEAFVHRTAEHGQEWERFATKWFDGANEWHWSFRGPPGRSQDWFMNGTSHVAHGNVASDLPLGEWHHVAITGDPVQGLRIWQNGVVVGSSPYAAPIGGGDHFRIGNAAPGESMSQFSGWVDEFQIHNVSRDAVYMAGRTALVRGAPAITRFQASPAVIAEGGSTTLEWTVSGALSVTLDGGGFVNSDVTGQEMAIATNLTETTTFTLTANNNQGSSSMQLTVGVGAADAPLVISEFLALNSAGLRDGDGDDSDWIEIFNPNAVPASLAGWYLTDDAANLTKWRFPSGSVPALGYLVVFASGKDRTTGEWHTNFKLAGDGEFLALVMPDGTTVATAFAPTYPPQQENVSYGFEAGTSMARALFPPTPGAPNATPAGPIIRNLTENPMPVPGDEDPIVITAEILPSPSPVLEATLHYRVMFDPEVAIPMTDIGGGLFRATIPASASLPNQMVRWYVTAESHDGIRSRAPLFHSPENSPEFHGTVIADPAGASQLPVMHRFLSNPAAAETRTGTRGAFSYNGEFFDNIFIRIRGNSSVYWPKKSYKIEFNDGHHFRFREGVPRVDEINLNTTYSDKSYVRPVLAYEHQRDAGMPSPEAFLVHLRQNGDFWSVAVLVEQPDRDFLRRWGLDPDGALYKGATEWTHYEPATPLSRWEKKTRLHEDKSDLDTFIDGLAQTATPLEHHLFDNVDLPVQINYMATTAITQNIDGSDKNHYLYRDTEGSGEWCMLPWDLDLTFGPVFLNTDTMVSSHAYASHPYIGARPYLLHEGKYNHFLEAIIATPRTRAMLNRRIRTLIDEHLSSGYFHNRIDALVAQIGADVLLDKAAWGSNAHFPGGVYSLQQAADRIKNEYLNPRVPYLTDTEGPGGGPAAAGIPPSQPSMPFVAFGAIEHSPASGNQDEEFIELANPNAFDLDVSGWMIEGGVDHRMKGGTVIPAGESLYLSPDVAAFRSRVTPPTGGAGLFVQGNYSGHLSNFGEPLVLRDAAGTVVAETTTPNDPTVNQLHLIISEIMYHPAGDAEAEFIELQNISDSLTLDLTGVRFTRGVTFDFSGSAVTSLAPGSRVLVVRNLAAFEGVHGPGLPVAGEFAESSGLNNGGEVIKLEDGDNSTIKEFAYDDTLPWPTAADGTGPSLVLVNPSSNPDPALPGSWRSSSLPGGNPGTSDATTFQGIAGADSDANGLDDLLDYALGHEPGARDGLPVVVIEGGNVILTYRRNLAADDVMLTGEWSVDMIHWQPLGADFGLVSLVSESGGRESIALLSDLPSRTSGGRIFLRVRASR